MDNPAILFILAAILLFAVVGVIYLLTGMQSKSRLDTEKYQSRWLAIEHALDRNTPASWQLAVMNADRLLDQALKDSRYAGKTMGERMKAANSVWKNANHVWGAHKVRNQLAHEPDAHITYEIAARSLAAFKQGLKDLGAI